MLDFTNAKLLNRGFNGANGTKRAYDIDGKQYMVKYPARAKRNHNLKTNNGNVSEYLGCNIFEILGIPVQKTTLVKQPDKETDDLVVCVACEYITTSGFPEIMPFMNIKNQDMNSSGGTNTELSEILARIDELTFTDPQDVKTRFWEMFVVDAFIGNIDRHNGNWGFLYNGATDEVGGLAPVYDCGSCLYPEADLEIINSIISGDKESLRVRIDEFPWSAINLEGKHINYKEFLNTYENKDLDAALERITPRIIKAMDSGKIQKLIDETPFITDAQKSFYNIMLTERYKQIIEPAYHKAHERIIGAIEHERPTLRETACEAQRNMTKSMTPVRETKVR